MAADLLLTPKAAELRYGLPEIESVFDRPAILQAVRQALIDHSNGRFVNARPTHLTFPNGDCHIKSGHMVDGDIITIKIATGFYSNEEIGLPNANGLVFVLDQHTGIPLALFEDAGWLTAWRTVAASVLAVQARKMAEPLHVGVVGAGLQAELAVQWLSETLEPASLRIWARSMEKAQGVAHRAGAGIQVEPSLPALCEACNVIVTATPSEKPLVMSEWVRPGTHIVALGADNPGKIEIDPELFGRAAAIVTDDHDQCVHHGDFGAAIRAGVVAADADIPLGCVLSGELSICRDDNAISIIDLTGLAAQDDATARLFLQRLRPA